MWTKENLQELVRTRLDGRRLILVSNREPYQHFYNRGRIESSPPASGMVTALEPIMKTCGGTWIAHASGNADRRVVDAMDHVPVPPDKPNYTLRRVWLTKEQEDGYYNGLSNEGLWPLCHMVFTRPIFNPRHWEAYRQVNEIFARAVLQEAGDDPAFVFIQDYHFALLPQMLKERNPNLIVAQFWHIPWPTPEVLQTFPWKEELMEGLLGNDLLGFHLRYHCQNFLNSADRTLEAKIDSERFEIIRGGKGTLVRPFPISIDFEEHVELAGGRAVKLEMERWRDSLSLSNEQALGIGIDRIDYTKGIPERLRGVDCFLEKYPWHREKLAFVQIGVPSRTHIPQYQALDDEIDGLVESINWKWSTDAWRPIIYLKHQHSAVQMMALHRLARFAIVSSLDDGMNLVAKEFVASRVDEDGVLILSRFTGAARELTHALLVNPFAVEEQADALHQALEMPEEERHRRMSRLRGVVAENNVYRWAGKLLSTLLKLEFPENAYAENGLLAAVS
jgi:alpha,alpha-trehalose-phosphate synthase [UDP-forming]